MRMRALVRGRLCPRGKLPVGLAGRFSELRILESNGCLLILLADNYNRTTNDLTTEAQSAQRTHRDDLLTKVRDHSPVWQFLRSDRKQRPAAHRSCGRDGAGPGSLSVRCLWAGRPGSCRRLPAYRSGLNLWCREKEDS